MSGLTPPGRQKIVAAREPTMPLVCETGSSESVLWRWRWDPELLAQFSADAYRPGCSPLDERLAEHLKQPGAQAEWDQWMSVWQQQSTWDPLDVPTAGRHSLGGSLGGSNGSDCAGAGGESTPLPMREPYKPRARFNPNPNHASKRQRLLSQALDSTRVAEAVGRAILQISELKGDVEARLAASERKLEAQSLAGQSTLCALGRESAANAAAHEEKLAAAEVRIAAAHEEKLAAAEARIAAHEEKLAAAEARIAVAEQLAERRLKASETTIASLQAELQAVREMATKTQQAALRNKPSQDQVLVLLKQKANLSEFDLSGLDLSSVRFGDAQLVGANFEDADLRNADLRGAGANLTGADMRDSQLEGAVGLGKAPTSP